MTAAVWQGVRVASRDDGGGFDTPEAAALAGWAGAGVADPRVVSVDIRGSRAEVIIEVGPSYPDWVYCYRLDDGWHEACSGNMPSTRWDDPGYLIWPDSPKDTRG